MKYISDDNEYELRSGRRFYANCGVIGLGPELRGFGFSEGYDGGDCADSWTDAERQELAEAMIERWRAWLNQGRHT